MNERMRKRIKFEGLCGQSPVWLLLLENKFVNFHPECQQNLHETAVGMGNVSSSCSYYYCTLKRLPAVTTNVPEYSTGNDFNKMNDEWGDG